VLILKEFLPAKVAESTPLAELYYLAQTLPLVKLIPSTHKVVTSNMFESALTEGKINVVHSRIEELKRQGKWSLRQPTRFVDPIRSQYRTQWDNLLSEMNWMATDFKEERKLRVTSCAFIAQSVADYWKFGKVCCIKRKPIKYIVDDMSELIEFPKEEQEEDQALPETSMEKDDDSIDISKLLKRPNPEDEIIAPDLPEVSLEDYLDYKETQSPFKLSIDTNEMKPNDKSLIDNLPIFSSFQNFDDYYSSAPLIPVSKVVLPVEDENYYNVYFKNIIDDSNVIPDQQKGLFGFSSQKKISTSIKPPSPPNLKYLDLRTPTIWLPEDDQDLIEYVNQFSFNWGVVSAHLSKKPTRSYSSNIERRTPWQCFERYIQLNDTFQINDMRGSNTLNAMKWLEHAHNIQATTKRRISPLGVGVESIQRGHKRLRWASMFEAVRKCMRKRESITRPNTNQVRKPLDDKKLPAPTPAELSKLKYERDKAIQDAYLQNSAGFRGRPNPNVAGSRPVSGANPLPATQAQSQVQPTRPGQAPNGNPIAPSTNNVGTARIPQPTSGQAVGAVQQSQVQNNSISQSSPSLSPNVQRPNNVSVPGSTQQQPAINAQRVLNNNQAPKLTAPNGQPYTPEQLQQFVQMRQRKALQQQNAINGGSSVGNSNTSSPTMVNAQLNANNSLSSRSSSNPNATPSQNPSPVVAQNQIPMNKMNSPVNIGRNMAFVPAHVSAVISQIQAKNPNLSKAEVTKMAAQYLANLQAKQQSRNVQGNGFIEGVSSAGPVNQRSNSQQGASTSLQRPTNSAAASSPLQQQNSVSPALTPQQKAQLDMLKALHAEQQQKRQQSAKNSSSSSTGNGSGTGSPGNVVANNPSNKSNSSDGGD
jgi:chromatin modification-related protein VID21